MLVGAGELVEQGGLAAVLVARQRKGDGCARGQRVCGTAPFCGRFAKARVGDGLHRTQVVLVVMFSFHLFGGAGVHALNVDAFCILQAQGQLVAPQLQFDGVAHGGNLAQGHQRARGEAHVQKMAAQRAGAIHRRDGGGFADRQLIKCHCVNPSFEKTGQPPRLWYGFNTLL